MPKKSSTTRDSILKYVADRRATPETVARAAGMTRREARSRINALRRDGILSGKKRVKIKAFDAEDYADEIDRQIPPPGWSGTVAAMLRKHPDRFSVKAPYRKPYGKKMNPYAIAWAGWHKGYQAHYAPKKKKDVPMSPASYRKSKAVSESLFDGMFIDEGRMLDRYNGMPVAYMDNTSKSRLNYLQIGHVKPKRGSPPNYIWVYRRGNIEIEEMRKNTDQHSTVFKFNTGTLPSGRIDGVTGEVSAVFPPRFNPFDADEVLNKLSRVARARGGTQIIVFGLSGFDDNDFDDDSLFEDYRVPEGARKAAARGLEARREHGRGGLSPAEAKKQGIISGVTRAKRLIAGKASEEDVKRMRAFFARHSAFKKHHSDPTSAAKISWDLWGGDQARKWVNSLKLEN